MPLVTKTFSDIITFTRTSGATYFDSNGVLQTAGNNVPRLDYNPITLAAQGLLIEEQRTNSIRNNTMQGAVAGTPGTLPTNWQVVGAGLGTLTQTIVGTGTSAGINYIDVRINGTTSTTSFGISFEQITQIVASSGQTWTGSVFLARVGGTTTNLTINVRLVERDAAGTFLDLSSNDITSSVGTSLSRIPLTRTLTNASTARINSDVLFAFLSGATIDITLRIGLPQLELGAFATSVIPTTTTALTRSADVASVNTLSPWWNASAGTLFAEFNVPFALTSGTNPRLFAFVGAGGPAFDDLFLTLSQASGKNASLNIIAGGVNPGRIDASASFVSGATVKAAGAYTANDRAVTSGGSAPTTSATAYTIPTVTVARIGSQDASGNNALNGYLRRVTYYPRRLSNAELQAITT